MFFITEDTKHTGAGSVLHHLHYLHDGLDLDFSASSLMIRFCSSMSRSYMYKARFLPSSPIFVRASSRSILGFSFRTTDTDSVNLIKSLQRIILLIFPFRIRLFLLAGVRHLRPASESCIILDNALRSSSMRVHAFIPTAKIHIFKNMEVTSIVMGGTPHEAYPFLKNI